MRTSIWPKWLCWAFLVPGLAGCQNYFGTQGPPHDPLFLSKIPTTGKAEFTSPVAFAYLEPSMPRDPFAQDAGILADKNGDRVSGTLTNRIKDQE